MVIDYISTGAGDYFGAFDKYERSEDDIKKAQEENAKTKTKTNPKDKAFEVRLCSSFIRL